MKVKKLYVAGDGQQFDFRMDAVRYESRKRREANSLERFRIKEERNRRKAIEALDRRDAAYNRSLRIQEERRREIDRKSSEKRQIKEDELKKRLFAAFGEKISPAINIIVKNKKAVKEILSIRM